MKITFNQTVVVDIQNPAKGFLAEMYDWQLKNECAADFTIIAGPFYYSALYSAENAQRLQAWMQEKGVIS